MSENRANTLTEVRAAILNEAFKGLLVVNGGGAIATATLVQAVWNDWPQDALRFAIWAIVPPIFGIGFALISTILRYINSLLPGSTRPFQNPWWWSILCLQIGSVILFMLGMSLVVFAGLSALVG